MEFYWIPWIVIGIVLGGRALYDFQLYKMGKYIKSKYPDRYEKQLTSSRPFLTEFFHTKKQFAFPYNIGEILYWKVSKNTKKVIDIAQSEKDQVLLARANRLYKINLPLILLLIIFVVLITFDWIYAR